MTTFTLPHRDAWIAFGLGLAVWFVLDLLLPIWVQLALWIPVTIVIVIVMHWVMPSERTEQWTEDRLP